MHFAFVLMQNGQLTAQKRSFGNDDTDDSSEVPTKRSLEMDTGAFYSKTTTPKSARKDTGQKLLRKAKDAMVAKQASSNSNCSTHYLYISLDRFG